MISRFFIDRPIFASVLSIVITLAGAVALFSLPLSLYPPVSPPTVQVDCRYPGASAQVVAETVAAPIEQQVNGVENMLYMSSQCTNDGSYNLTVTFKHGVDLNMAQVLVQNRVSLATPLLPEVIKQTGVTTRKKAPDILMAIAFNSPTGRYDQLYLSNYAWMRIREELSRLPGVADVTMLGQRDYSMRIWVDPHKLASRNLTAGDVVSALREQNAQVATGQVGQPPVPDGQEIQVTLSTLGRLITIEQFENVIIKSLPDGRVTRIKDVATVELGAKNEDISCQVNGRPSVSLAVFQLPDANALGTAEIVRGKMQELAKDFPEGLQYEIRYDTTPFIRESIFEVFKTLREAIILVAVVVLLFLQNWRSSVIPLIAVPVAIVGTFAVMAAFGFSLNNLTLFGLVLAIGIVVDDAIVVVESVEHHMERGLAPREATIRAMEDVSGPVIAIGLVLSAVFVPCGFISGIVGQFFRQFALTIATSTIISAFNSLTLSPALAALLLRRHDHHSRTKEVLPWWMVMAIGGWLGWDFLSPQLAPVFNFVQQRLHLTMGSELAGWVVSISGALGGMVLGGLLCRTLNLVLSWVFWWFNEGFRVATNGYAWGVTWLLRLSFLVLVAYGGLLGATYWGFSKSPKGFIPSQDMGYLLINVQLPDSASNERTVAVMNHIERIAKTTPGVKHTQGMTGQSLLLSAYGSNFGSMFVILDDFSRRRSPNLTGEAIANALRKRFTAEEPGAQIAVFPPPPVRGVGRAGGFKLMIEDRGDVGPETLQGQTENVVEKGNEQPGIVGLSSVFRANVPQLYVDVDRTACMAKEVALKDLFDTLQIYLGSLYVNDFNLFGRTWQVIVQADSRFRDQVEQVRGLKVRNARGNMIPLGTLATVREINGPLVLTRYNMYPAAPINGNAAQGTSSGEAISVMQDLSKQELLPSMSYEWTELAYLELQAGNTAMIVFLFAVIMVFLVLAAQYESWALPLAIILVVPLCLLSAIVGIYFAHEDINVFTQIGFVVLIGLASKNAILIVEFAKSNQKEGVSCAAATIESCRLRLRPIIMTSFAFILGVLPLMLSHGAGAEMRRTLGITAFSGMLGVTLFGIFLTPVFFYVINRLSELPMFASPLLRRLNSISLNLFALGFLRRWVQRPRSARKPRPATTTTRPAPAQEDSTELVEQR